MKSNLRRLYGMNSRACSLSPQRCPETFSDEAVLVLGGSANRKLGRPGTLLVSRTGDSVALSVTSSSNYCTRWYTSVFQNHFF